VVAQPLQPVAPYAAGYFYTTNVCNNHISKSFKQTTMAKQKGIIQLEGTIGNITFLKTKDGFMAKQKSEVSASKIASDPAFQRTRENNAEFGRAAKAGKTLRVAFRSLIQKAKDAIYVARITQVFTEVIRMDQTNPRGQRNVIDGEAELLQSFEFNDNAKLSATLFAPYNAVLNRVTGDANISIDPFVPADAISIPGGTTHFKVVAGAAEIDFENEVYNVDVSETGFLLVNNLPTAAINLNHSLPANSTHPLFLILGLQFYQEVNGTQYPLRNGIYNCLSVVKVDAL
jgi:hypothetical protein